MRKLNIVCCFFLLLLFSFRCICWIFVSWLTLSFDYFVVRSPYCFVQIMRTWLLKCIYGVCECVAGFVFSCSFISILHTLPRMLLVQTVQKLWILFEVFLSFLIFIPGTKNVDCIYDCLIAIHIGYWCEFVGTKCVFKFILDTMYIRVWSIE